jgi:hypothetical protein
MEEISKNILVFFKTSSQRNNKMVWDASIDIVQGLFGDVWAGEDVITVHHCVDITLPVRYDPLLVLYPSSMVAYV